MKITVPFLLILAVAIQACHIDIEEPAPVIVYADERDYFTGVFNVEEYSETFDVHNYYTIDVVKAAGYPGMVYLRNFYGAGVMVLAEVEGVHLYIPHQEINGFEIEGEGIINDHRLDLYYTVHDHLAAYDFIDYCSSTAWR
ncbi:hypothetical protein C900_00055 [Fulvivirga imtechensis AK7]|uniref:Uncharacterized protein n=1 Tax=Fulvivirga imtechensis AK7 TaxID=1237149 RepID=L8JXV6_9BACT|nr:hypothetical protein [Fulvivirga imtechensis]ELR73891.1 hypothetical protein C900_00055 [Fulvivirga imtechensis AK7]